MWWSRKKPVPTPPLAPGECECGHIRCAHEKGRGRCVVYFDGEYLGKPQRMKCGCQIFILDDRDDDDDDPEDAPTPSPEELERMVGGRR